jgi:hypothetical protein
VQWGLNLSLMCLIVLKINLLKTRLLNKTYNNNSPLIIPSKDIQETEATFWWLQKLKRKEEENSWGIGFQQESLDINSISIIITTIQSIMTQMIAASWIIIITSSQSQEVRSTVSAQYIVRRKSTYPILRTHPCTVSLQIKRHLTNWSYRKSMLLTW